jgi:hypothetical protein
MPHIVFFSYARENLDPYLDDFFKDLAGEIAPHTPWPAEDERVAFTDRNNIRLMENWAPRIDEALQTTSVLVCITSVAYFLKEFCGKEYYVFDQRRRQGLAAGTPPPPVILPVIWAPVLDGLPEFMTEPQYVPPGIADEYRRVGLRRLKRLKRPAYDECVVAFADAIRDAAHRYNIPRLPDAMDFDEIPNAFASGDWQEAAGPRGWLTGPEVANFVFAGRVRGDVVPPTPRFGDLPAHWRPYLPPRPTTILEYAKNVARKKFKFREIRVDSTLAEELAAARNRKNLTIMVADPHALPLPTFQRARAIEDLWWEGTALVLPCDDSVPRAVETGVPQGLEAVFPMIAQTSSAAVRVAGSDQELETVLDVTLTELRAAVTKAETDRKEKTDAPPPDLHPSGARP